MLSKIFHRRRNRIRLEAQAHKYRLPSDIWLEILSLLPFYVIPTMTLTCRFLRLLAQPILFRQLLAHPFLRALSHRRIKPQAYSKRNSHRLNFFTSLQIAPAVQECSILPYPPGHWFPHPDIALDSVLDAIFEALLHFPNLKRLICDQVQLTPKRLAILHGLRLEVLELARPELGVKLLPYRTYVSKTNCRRNAPPLSTPFGHIHEIAAGFSDTKIVLSSITAMKLPLFCLSTLDIHISVAIFPDLVPALTYCPALERICLRYSRIAYGPFPLLLPPGILPNLTSYYGPYIYASVFAESCTLHEVTLWGYEERKVDIPQTLEKLGAQVKSLNILVGEVTPSALLAIHTTFPFLASLGINADRAQYPPLLEIATLRAAFGEMNLHGLKSLFLGVALPRDAGKPEAFLRAFHLIRSFTQTCPSLQVVILHLFRAFTRCPRLIWRRGPPSRPGSSSSPIMADITWEEDMAENYFTIPVKRVWKFPWTMSLVSLAWTH